MSVNNIVTDCRTLNGLAKKYGFTYDKQFKYVTQYDEVTCHGVLSNSTANFKLEYVSGCFHPFIVQIGLRTER